MKELVLAAILLFAVALLAVFFVLRDDGARRKIVREGDQAPEFTLPGPDQRPVALAEYRGRVVVLHFWATWCPPCVEEMPKLEQLHRTFADSDLALLAVSVDDDGDAVSAFMRNKRLTFPALLDARRDVAGKYGTRKFPETFVIDRSGVVRFKAIGPLDWMAPETVEALRRLLQES